MLESENESGIVAGRVFFSAEPWTLCQKSKVGEPDEVGARSLLFSLVSRLYGVGLASSGQPYHADQVASWLAGNMVEARPVGWKSSGFTGRHAGTTSTPEYSRGALEKTHICCRQAMYGWQRDRHGRKTYGTFKTCGNFQGRFQDHDGWWAFSIVPWIIRMDWPLIYRPLPILGTFDAR